MNAQQQRRQNVQAMAEMCLLSRLSRWEWKIFSAVRTYREEQNVIRKSFLRDLNRWQQGEATVITIDVRRRRRISALVNEISLRGWMVDELTKVTADNETLRTAKANLLQFTASIASKLNTKLELKTSSSP